ALPRAEPLLAPALPGDPAPDCLVLCAVARLAAEATEIHRDLQMPHMVMRFEELATMPADTYPRSCGMRNAIVGSAHLQARRLDEGLQYGTAPWTSCPTSPPHAPSPTSGTFLRR